MRAREVPTEKAYCFDFDETLVKTDAKVHIYKNGRQINSITPAEYNFYKPKPGETTDMRDFDDPRFIIKAKKYKMWPALRNISMAKEAGRSSSDIFILTARGEKAQLPIYNFLKKQGIEIPLDHIITVGEEDGNYDIAAKKKEVLLKISNSYQSVIFFDDSHKNIELANEVPGIKTRLIDSLEYIK